MQYPEIQFSEWYRFEDRNKIASDLKLKGVYILGKFSFVLKNKADPLDEHIIYIGQTTRSLGERLKMFERCARYNSDGHSGGKEYYRQLTQKGDNLDDLYVAIFTVNIEHPIYRDTFIKYIERKVIFDFVNKRGKKPRINRD